MKTSLIAQLQIREDGAETDSSVLTTRRSLPKSPTTFRTFRPSSGKITVDRRSVTHSRLSQVQEHRAAGISACDIEQLSWNNLRNLDRVDERIQQEFFAFQSTTDENDAPSFSGTEALRKRKWSESPARKNQDTSVEGISRPDTPGEEKDSTALECVDETANLISALDSMQKSRMDLLTIGRATWPSRSTRVDIEAGFLYFPSTDEGKLIEQMIAISQFD
ncbi:unnamed protein product [Echinostoma caproni]|uniref:Uncharacterized protein n=1 Tax=Echinostoma caproni TaxID=27848 RepID=A0A183ARJ6_9TREM|nr:unnamed protein product [Echinostoma caproni]